jgi:hypothetical protein
MKLVAIHAVHGWQKQGDGTGKLSWKAREKEKSGKGVYG